MTQIEQLRSTQARLIEALKEAMRVVSDRAAGGRMLTTTQEASDIWDQCAKAIHDAQSLNQPETNTSGEAGR